METKKVLWATREVRVRHGRDLLEENAVSDDRTLDPLPLFSSC